MGRKNTNATKDKEASKEFKGNTEKRRSRSRERQRVPIERRRSLSRERRKNALKGEKPKKSDAATLHFISRKQKLSKKKSIESKKKPSKKKKSEIERNAIAAKKRKTYSIKEQSETSLTSSLKKFFSKKENLKQMLSIISQQSPISLRLLDWFVTNYAKEKQVSYYISEDSLFNVHLSYKDKLKGSTKKKLDPFKRGSRTIFRYKECNKDGDITKKQFETTVAQQNFFKWAIENGVIAYVSAHFDDIEAHMNNAKNRKTKKNIPKKAVVTNAKIILTFD